MINDEEHCRAQKTIEEHSRLYISHSDDELNYYKLPSCSIISNCIGALHHRSGRLLLASLLPYQATELWPLLPIKDVIVAIYVKKEIATFG